MIAETFYPVPLWARRTIGEYKLPLRPLFWTRIRRPYQYGDCWLWTGDSSKRDGYPLYSGKDARSLLFRLAGKAPVDGDVIKMRCGNKLCMNLDHLSYAPRGAHLHQN